MSPEFVAFIGLVLFAILPLILGYAVKLLKPLRDQALEATKAAAGESNYALLRTVVQDGVRFAEQSQLLSSIAKSDKKTIAIAFVKSALAAHGLGAIDVDLIAAMIEASVNELFPKIGQLFDGDPATQPELMG